MTQSFATDPVHNNLPAALVDFDAWTSDAILRAAVEREGGEWVEARAQSLGQYGETEPQLVR